MKHNTYSSKSLSIRVLRLTGGGKTLNISALRSSLISYFFLILVSFLCFACSKETSVSQYPEMQAYYAESCHLGELVGDSIQRFSQKIETFVTRHTDAKQDPLYLRIQENIRSASFRLSIYIDDEWEPEYERTF